MVIMTYESHYQGFASQQLKMSTVEKEGSPYLIIPYALRGRDFDQNFRAFTFPYFDMIETIPYYSSKDAKINSQFCDCMIYTKCQSITIHHPVTLSLLQKLIIDANKSDINNNNQNGLYLRCYLGNIGRTSSSWFIDLMYKDMVFVTCICMNVHVDPETRRPIENCQKLKDYKARFGSTNNKHNQNINKKLKHFRSSIDIITSKIKTFNDHYIENNIIYSRSFELRPLDRDWNNHTNQAVYTKRIEDALYEYHKGFSDNKYGITYFAHFFKHEMLINNDGSLKCQVNILMHNKLENEKQEEEVIGFISQNGIDCMEYRVILTPTRWIPSKL